MDPFWYTDAIVLGVAALLPFAVGLLLFGFLRRQRRKDRKPGIVSLFVGNTLVFLWLLSAASLIGELYYRYIYDATDAFTLTLNSVRFVDRHYYPANNWGARDDINYPDEPLPGEQRITFIGDSFTVGHGIRDVRDRFTNRIREQAGENWDIVVVANNGMDTGEELVALEGGFREGRHLGSVVLVYCLNDICDLHYDWNVRLKGIYDRYVEQRPFLVAHSYLVNTLYFRLIVSRDKEVGAYYDLIKDAYAGEEWEKQRERMRYFRDLCDRYGSDLLVVTFPFFDSPWDRYAYRHIHAQLDEEWKSLGVPYLDLLPVFEGHDAQTLVVNRYDPHPNPRANALAQEAVTEFLRENLRPLAKTQHESEGSKRP